MKANIYVLLFVFIIGFIAALFQTEAWAIYVLIPCGLYVAYSFIYMMILVFKSYKKK